MLLPSLARFTDAALLLLRWVTGAFLLYQSHDNVISWERMVEFQVFLERHGFFAPELMAPLSVYAQFLCGLALVLGLLTRWAGLVITFNFIVAVYMVHLPMDFTGWWPALILVFLGLLFAAAGAGRYSVDAKLSSRLPDDWAATGEAAPPVAS